MSEHDIVLNILAQQPSLNLYTQICLCFPVDDASTEPNIIEKLSRGLKLLATSFPWTAGNIINEGANENNTGVCKIRPTSEIPLVIKDLKNEPTAPTMEGLRKARFPINMLDENMLCPRKTMLRNSPQSGSESLPVFIVQANLISGGLILAFLGHHQAMDMVGQGHIMRLLSEACRHERFIESEVGNGQLECNNLGSLFDDSWKPGEELDDPGPVNAPQEPVCSLTPAPLKCTWTYLTIGSDKLASIRSDVWNTISIPPEHVPSHNPNAASSGHEVEPDVTSSHYVSTDDLITALLWQSIARARLSRLNPTAESTLGRAVDVRRYLGIQVTYPGCMASKVQHKLSLQSLTNQPLLQLALELRKAVDPRTSTIVEDVRKTATILSRTANKSRPKSSAQRDSGLDVSFSSWRKVDICGLDFGLGLGPPTVRRPKFDPLEGIVYIMPKARGSVEDDVVALCLRDEDMEKMREDEQFGKYASFIG